MKERERVQQMETYISFIRNFLRNFLTENQSGMFGCVQVIFATR